MLAIYETLFLLPDETLFLLHIAENQRTLIQGLGSPMMLAGCAHHSGSGDGITCQEQGKGEHDSSVIITTVTDLVAVAAKTD